MSDVTRPSSAGRRVGSRRRLRPNVRTAGAPANSSYRPGERTTALLPGRRRPTKASITCGAPSLGGEPVPSGRDEGDAPQGAPGQPCTPGLQYRRASAPTACAQVSSCATGGLGAVGAGILVHSTPRRKGRAKATSIRKGAAGMPAAHGNEACGAPVPARRADEEGRRAPGASDLGEPVAR